MASLPEPCLPISHVLFFFSLSWYSPARLVLPRISWNKYAKGMSQKPAILELCRSSTFTQETECLALTCVDTPP